MSIHKPLFIAIALLIVAGPAAHAADDTKYKADTTVARNADGHLVCQVKITTNAGTDRESILSSPRVIFHDGHAASVRVGDEKPRPNDPKTTAFSGVHVRLLHAVGDDSVVVITRVVENDKNIWVDAKRVKIAEKKPEA